MKVTKQRKYSSRYDYSNPGFIRVENSVLTELGGRNAWVAIKSNERTIYRMIRGAGRIKNFSKDLVETDYDTLLELNISEYYADTHIAKCDLVIEKANVIQILLGYWNHPDISYRFALKISIVSFMLGVLGLVLGTVSVIQ